MCKMSLLCYSREALKAEGQTPSKGSDAGRSPLPVCGREGVGGEVGDGPDSAGAHHVLQLLSQGQWEIIERFTFIFEKDNPS